MGAWGQRWAGVGVGEPFLGWEVPGGAGVGVGGELRRQEP